MQGLRLGGGLGAALHAGKGSDAALPSSRTLTADGSRRALCPHGDLASPPSLLLQLSGRNKF